MSTFYLDTSAFVKKYKSEPGTPVIRELFDGLRAYETLITSWLTTVEVEATASRALRGGVWDRQLYEDFLTRFANDTQYRPVVLQGVPRELMRDAVNLTRHYALRGADAVQLATATQVRDAFAGTDSVIFVCSDHQLHQAAAAERLEILDPELPDALEYLRKLRPSNPLPNI